MQPPRAHNYHFAYSVLPQMLFRADGASIVAAIYPVIAKFVQEYWNRLGSNVPEGDRVIDGSPVCKGYKLAGKDLALVVELPAPERALEVVCVAIIFRPEVRYFVLGLSPAVAPEFSDMMGVPRATIREVTPTMNARVGSLFELSVPEFLESICHTLEVPNQVEDATEADFKAVAPYVPFYDPLPSNGARCMADMPEISESPAPSASNAPVKAAWWQFWKNR